MNRRDFLSRVAAACASLVLGKMIIMPESVVIPPGVYWISNLGLHDKDFRLQYRLTGETSGPARNITSEIRSLNMGPVRAKLA